MAVRWPALSNGIELLRRCASDVSGHAEGVAQTKLALKARAKSGGVDGTRTRGLRRDRPAF